MAIETIWVKQSSFAGGEVSPSMRARTDVPKLGMAALTMRNYIALAHGAATPRPGFEFMAATKDSTKLSRLIEFRYSIDQRYTLEFGYRYIRFHTSDGVIIKTVDDTDAWLTGTAYADYDYVKNGGLIYRCISAHTSGSTTEPGIGASWSTKWVQDDIYEIASAYDDADLSLINPTQSADIMYLLHSEYHPQMLTRFNHNDWSLTLYPFKNGPFMPDNTDETKTITASATTGTVNLISNFDIFQSGHLNALFQITHRVAGQRAQAAFSASGQVSSAVKGKGKWKVVTHGTWTGSLDLEKTLDGVNWTIERSYSVAADTNIIDSDIAEELASYRLKCTAYTSGTINYDLTMQPHYWTGIVKIATVTGLRNATAIVQDELAANTATFRWAEGSWSDYRGWPACGTFYQDRFVPGGSTSEPQTAWPTRTSDYNNFVVSDPVVDDDAITISLVGRQGNTIRAMVALSHILAFTTGDIYKISAAGDGVMTPSSRNAVSQTSNGISEVDPIVVGNRVVYVQTRGTIVRDIGYSLNDDSYRDSDLTVYATHLFQGRKVAGMTYQSEPDPILWFWMSDGTFLGLTYLREQEIWAWHRHDTDGFIESMCMGGGSTRDELWAIVRRSVNGQTMRYIERMAARYYPNIEDYIYLDSAFTYDGPEEEVISGLFHLEGKTVDVLANGVWVNGLTVTDGDIHLPQPATKAHIGLSYLKDLELPDVDLDLKDGTAQGRNKKVVSVILRVQESHGGKVGPAFDGLMDDIPYAQSGTWGNPAPLFTGDIRMTFPGDVDTSGRVCIRQEAPLPLTILSVIREVKFDG